MRQNLPLGKGSSALVSLSSLVWWLQNQILRFSNSKRCQRLAQENNNTNWTIIFLYKLDKIGTILKSINDLHLIQNTDGYVVCFKTSSMKWYFYTIKCKFYNNFSVEIVLVNNIQKNDVLTFLISEVYFSFINTSHNIRGLELPCCEFIQK